MLGGRSRHCTGHSRRHLLGTQTPTGGARQHTASRLLTGGLQSVSLPGDDFEPGISLGESVGDKIDIGGVALLRAAARTLPAWPSSATRLIMRACWRSCGRTGSVSEATRRRLAAIAFAHTRDYDTAIAAYTGAGSLESRRRQSSSHTRSVVSAGATDALRRESPPDCRPVTFSVAVSAPDTGGPLGEDCLPASRSATTMSSISMPPGVLQSASAGPPS